MSVSTAAAAAAHLTDDTAARFLVTAFNSTSNKVFTDVYFISEYAAPPIMAFALWRRTTCGRGTEGS
jgi:hypothetical protein